MEGLRGSGRGHLCGGREEHSRAWTGRKGCPGMRLRDGWHCQVRGSPSRLPWSPGVAGHEGCRDRAGDEEGAPSGLDTELGPAVP